MFNNILRFKSSSFFFFFIIPSTNQPDPTTITKHLSFPGAYVK